MENFSGGFVSHPLKGAYSARRSCWFSKRLRRERRIDTDERASEM